MAGNSPLMRPPTCDIPEMDDPYSHAMSRHLKAHDCDQNYSSGQTRESANGMAALEWRVRCVMAMKVSCGVQLVRSQVVPCLRRNDAKDDNHRQHYPAEDRTDNCFEVDGEVRHKQPKDTKGSPAGPDKDPAGILPDGTEDLPARAGCGP
eukprot:scaffold132337_cov30-Prasinocladus_malaysianus.AAC.1